MALNYKFEFILTDPNDPDSVPITREIISTSNAVQFIPLEEDFGKDLSVNLTVYNQYGQSTQQQDLGRIVDEFPEITVTGGTFNSELVKVNSTVDVTPIYFGGNPETPVIQYNFVDQTGESLQNSTSSSYTITPDDLNSQLSVIIVITDIDGRVSTPFPLLLGIVADEFPNPFINSITVTGAPRLGNTVTVTEVNYAGGNPNNPVFEYEFVSRDANDGTEQSLKLSDEASYDIPPFSTDNEEDDELLDKILLVRVKVIDVDGRESNIETESLGVIDDLDVPAIESLTITGRPLKLGNTITVTDVDYIGGNQNDPPLSVNYKFFVNGVLQTSDGSSYEIPIDFNFIGKILNVEVQLTDADGRESQPYTLKLGSIIDQYASPIISSFGIDGEVLLGRTVSVTNVNYSGGNPIDPTFEYEFVSIENGEVQSLQLSNSPSYDIPPFSTDNEEDDELLGKILRVDFKVTDADGRESPTVRYVLGTVSDEYSDITMSLSYSGKPYPDEVITATIEYEGGNPSTDNPDFPQFTFLIQLEDDVEYTEVISPENQLSYTLPGTDDIGKTVDITGTVEDVDGRNASQILSLVIEEQPATEPPTIDDVTYDGDLNPGQDLDITVQYSDGDPPYKIEYEVIEAVAGSDDIVIESGETTSKTSEANFQYTIQVADLGKTLGVKVKVFDSSSPPLSSQELRALIGDVFTTISLDITTDVDNDEKADIYDDEVKVQSPDVPAGKLLPKWFMKYRG